VGLHEFLGDGEADARAAVLLQALDRSLSARESGEQAGEIVQGNAGTCRQIHGREKSMRKSP
jgi:hypothetical protein